MAQQRRERSPRQTRTTDEERWAALADLVLIVAREISLQGYLDERAVSLNQSEGMVMRVLQGHPDATPSRIAAATGLQRSNLSVVLRGLEKKGLVERQYSADDGRGVTVRATEQGVSNYHVVRREWANMVSKAAGGDTTRLESAVTLLANIEAGMTSDRPRLDVSTTADVVS